MNLSKKLHCGAVALAAILFMASTAVAQDTNSPYSKFGYGLLRDKSTSTQRAMGGIGYAMNSGRQINPMNPASYAAIDSLTFLFDTGVTLSNEWYTDGDDKLSETGGGLDYITMQFPLGKYMGGSVGLVPYSSVGYSFGSTIDHGTSTRTGEGGINEVYLGLSGRPFKGFTVGANVSYLFGTTYNHVLVTSDISVISRFSQMMQVRDWHLDFGAQYSFDVNPKNRVTLGVVFSPGKSLLGHTLVTTAEMKTTSTGLTPVPADTVVDISLRDHFSLPATYGAGINYRWDNRLMVEVDFTYQPWKKAKFLDIDNYLTTNFDNRWKVAAGAEYTPAQRGGYFRRVSYRLGGFYNRDYVMVGTNHVRDWGVSLGLGLPAPGQKTVINLGFEYRNRRATPVPMLKENYFNISLGINFNELWFWQNKIR